MLKQKTVLEVQSGDFTFSLHCAPESPLGLLYDSLCKMQSFVIAKIKESEVKAKEDESAQQEKQPE